MNSPLPLAVTLTADRLSVSTSDTSFININKLTKPDIEETLDMLKEVTKLARGKGVKVSRKNGYKATLEAIRDSIDSDWEQYLKLYDSLLEGYTAIVGEGIYTPLVGDERLEAMYKLKAELDSLFYSSKALSKLINVNYQVKSLLTALEGNVNYTLITI